jgi:DnaJ like chaperone protein
MVELLVRVANADGHISANKEQLIASAVRIFQIDPYSYAQLRGFYFPGASTDSIDRHYAVLKCKPEDSNEEIKAKYRKLTMEYHPDRIQSKGLPEDFMKFSTQKFQEIQKAYETIKRERGF